MCAASGAKVFRSQPLYGCADDGGRMRLDVLAANGAVVRLGHEFWICGTQTTFDQHVARGYQYADQHACTVNIVNVVLTDGNFEKNVHLPLPNPKAQTCS